MSTVWLGMFMAEVIGGRARGRPWLIWMDGVKVALIGQHRDEVGGCKTS